MTGGTVLYVGNFELPDRNAAAHRVTNNAKLFASLGLRTVFLGASRGEEHFDGIVKRDYGSGFDTYEQAYPSTTGQWVRQIFDVRNVTELASKYPDTAAVILYNTQYSTLLAVKKAFAGTGVRVIYDCTEWNGSTDGAFAKRAVKAIDSRLIEYLLPRACDGLIVVSTRMSSRYGSAKPLLLLPPLVDTDDAIWRAKPREDGIFTFCYAGDPSDKDRLDILTEAFSRLPAGSARLRIIGVERRDFSGAVIPEGAEFTGRLSHEEAVGEMLSCGCFIFLREPSRRNSAGFPTKFAEASTCGVPVITTAVSDIPLYAPEDCVVLGDVRVDKVADAMAEVMSRPGGERRPRDTFDYRKQTDACRLWLERVLCRKD